MSSRTARGWYYFFTVPFIWPLHETPHDEYRYTPYALEKLLQDAGFRDIQIKSGGGWHASLAQMMGLWARKAPLKNWQRKFTSISFLPIIKYLLSKDQKIDHTIREQQLFTNFYGTARK